MTNSKAQKPTAKPTTETAAPAGQTTPKGKLGQVVNLLLQPEGATLEAMQAATGWQAHSVRGAISGAIKKKLGFAVSSEKTEAGRIYRIAEKAAG